MPILFKSILTFLRLNTVNLIFAFTSIIVLFGINLVSREEEMVYMVAIYIAWFLSGMSIFFHELKDVLLDYIGNKDTANRCVRYMTFIKWLGVIAFILALTIG